MRTKERLAQDLEAARAPKELIENARRGIYDDYESPLPCPIISLVNTCRRLGLNVIADKAQNGEYDCTKEEADEWFNREGKDLVGEDVIKILKGEAKQ